MNDINDEKVAMFMKSTKRELVDMLIGCTGVLSNENYEEMIVIKKDMKYSDLGWLPAKLIQPTNNREVVVVIEDIEDKASKIIDIGFFENDEWHLWDGENTKKSIIYWFPIPSWY